MTDPDRREGIGAELDALSDWDARRERVRDLMEAEGVEVVWDDKAKGYQLDLLGRRARSKGSPWAAVEGWAWAMILRARAQAALAARRVAE